MPEGPRRSHEPLLVGAIDAAQILGKRQSNLRAVKGLPEPYQKVRATTLWRADEIYARRDRLAAEKSKEGDQSVKSALPGSSGGLSAS
jgi:hypothetical protein